jgi:hypothetical protein
MLVSFQVKRAIVNWEEHPIKFQEDALRKRITSKSLTIDG